MGEERSWKREHLFFCLACCLSFMLGLAGCSGQAKQWHGRQDLREAESLMERGAYEASFNESLKLLNSHPLTLGDEALFHMGLLYVHPENPWADLHKARLCFERILKEFPMSRKKEEARLWLLTLRAKEEERGNFGRKLGLLESAVEEREKKLKQFQKELEEKDRKSSEAQKEIEERGKRVTELEREIEQLQSRMTELEAQLMKFKDVDLTIEQKKRATSH
jgi:hypothetical protein